MRCQRNHLNRPGLYFKGDSGSPDIEDTADQKALAQIAAQRWQSYQDTYKPAENKYIAEVSNFDKGSRMAQQSQMAQAGVRGAFTDTIQNDVDQMTQGGINPNSGQFQSVVGDDTRKMAEAETSNVTRTQQAIQDQKVQGLQNVTALGMGQSGNAIAGLGQTAAASAQDASERAIGSYNSGAANRQAAGTAVGAGLAGYSGYNRRQGAIA